MKRPSLLFTTLAVSALLFGFDIIKTEKCDGSPHCKDGKQCSVVKGAGNGETYHCAFER